jgi:Flp pilus assembly protein TadG
MIRIKTKFRDVSLELPSKRRGAVTVEAAIMLPILMLVTLGSTDFAQYINAAQLVSNASRVGARIASRDQTTSVSQVEDAIKDYFYNAYPQVAAETLDSAITVRTTHPDGSPIMDANLLTILSGQQVSVQVVFDFDKVRWIKGLDYWGSNVNQSTTIARRD